MNNIEFLLIKLLAKFKSVVEFFQEMNWPSRALKVTKL